MSRFIRTKNGRTIFVKGVSRSQLPVSPDSRLAKRKSSSIVFVNNQLQPIDESDLPASRKLLQTWPPSAGSAFEIDGRNYFFFRLPFRYPGRLEPETFSVNPPISFLKGVITPSEYLFGLFCYRDNFSGDFIINGWPTYPHTIPPNGLYFSRPVTITSITKAGTSTYTLNITFYFPPGSPTGSGSGSGSGGCGGGGVGTSGY